MFRRCSQFWLSVLKRFVSYMSVAVSGKGAGILREGWKGNVDLGARRVESRRALRAVRLASSTEAVADIGIDPSVASGGLKSPSKICERPTKREISAEP